jgi:L-fucose mutarotase
VLKDINPLLTPSLLAALRAMGHGDVIAIVDRNYPAYAAGRTVIDLPGVDTTVAAVAILSVLPVDDFDEPAVFHMHPVGEPDGRGPALDDFVAALEQGEGRAVAVAGIERFDFYRRAREAYCIVATGDARPYACFLIVKGVVRS